MTEKTINQRFSVKNNAGWQAGILQASTYTYQTWIRIKNYNQKYSRENFFIGLKFAKILYYFKIKWNMKV